MYFDIRRDADNHPQLCELDEQGKIYHLNLVEKQQQMKKLQFDLEVQKQDVDDLRGLLVDLEDKQKKLNTKWIEMASKSNLNEEDSTGNEEKDLSD